MTTARTGLIPPMGGALVDLIVPTEAQAELRAHASRLPSIQISERAVYDLELLATGGFSPLDRFMGRRDFERVVGEMRLAGRPALSHSCHAPGGPRRPRSGSTARSPCATRTTSCWASSPSRRPTSGTAPRPRSRCWARATCATRSWREMQRWGAVNLSGRLRVLALPPRHDFRDLRLTPAETRARLADLGASKVVAFQTRNPLHRAHEELTRRAADAVGGTLLLHPVVGHDQAGRRGLLHARAHLQGAGRALLRARARAPARCCRSPCAWRDRARRCGTRSSGATTGPATSSSAAITPAPAWTRRASPSTAPTTRRSWSGGTRRSWASACSPSAR